MHDRRKNSRSSFLDLVEDVLREILRFFRNKNHTSAEAVRAEGKLDTMQNATKFTYTEFDTNGKIVPINLTKNPISVSSDNPGVATIDQNSGVVQADGSVVFAVASVAGANGTANIVGVDANTLGPDGKPLAGGDVDTVVSASLPAVKATGVLS
jgi:hypothetical protein